MVKWYIFRRVDFRGSEVGFVRNKRRGEDVV